jgi:hypothetical protein
MTSKVAKVVLTILTCTSLSLPPTVAEAGMRTGTWRNGMVAGPYGIGWYGPRGYYGGPAYGGWRYGGYHPGSYGGYGYPSRFYGGYGYAPAYYGGYGYDPGYYYYRERRSNAGAALATGLIGGMALGAIIAGSAARAAPRCYVAPRRVISSSGYTYTRRVRLCR